MVGYDTTINTAHHYQSQMCERNLVTVCVHVLTVALPEDVHYWLAEVARDSELREFIVRLSVVMVIVMCVILCNIYKWQGLSEDDDDVVEVSTVTRTAERKLIPRTGGAAKSRSFDQQCTWTFWRIVGLVFTLMTLISIPWEFARLYQKEVSMRAAKTSAVRDSSDLSLPKPQL